MRMWYATLATKSFEFEGFGATEYAARRALHTALMQHQEEYDLGGMHLSDPNLFKGAKGPSD